MSEKTTTSSFPILGLLGLLFIALKLCGVLDWSWWWVLAPFWFSLPFLILAFIVFAVASIISSFKK